MNGKLFLAEAVEVADLFILIFNVAELDVV
jgi:hypothetical protein